METKTGGKSPCSILGGVATSTRKPVNKNEDNTSRTFPGPTYSRYWLPGILCIVYKHEKENIYEVPNQVPGIFSCSTGRRSCSSVSTRAQRQPPLITKCKQCYTILLGTTCTRTHDPNRRRHTKNKNYLSFLPSVSCEIPVDHANPCEPSKNTRASTASSPNLLRFCRYDIPSR